MIGPVSLSDYYKQFGLVKGGFTAFGALFPFCAAALQDYAAIHYIFPPIGESTLLAAFVASAFTFAATTYGYFTLSSGKHARALPALILALIFSVIYLALASTLIVKVDDPVDETATYVAVGFHRSYFANSTFPSDSDVYMLSHRGTTDEAIARLWTPGSLLAARMLLFLTSLGGLIGLSTFWSALVSLSISQQDKPL